MKKITYLNSILLLLIIVTGGYLLIKNNAPKEEQYVFVDNIVLFNEFNMTKEIKAKEESKLRVLKRELDSLFVIYNHNKESKNEETSRLEQIIATKNQEFSNIQNNFNNELSQQVWNRLNGYIKDYSKLNNYKLVLGTNGMGNIMYANDAIDVTKPFIEYSNNKYEGFAGAN